MDFDEASQQFADQVKQKEGNRHTRNVKGNFVAKSFDAQAQVGNCQNSHKGKNGYLMLISHGTDQKYCVEAC